MKNFVLLLTILLSLTFRANSQCTVTSTNGYQVNVGIFPRNVIASTTDCPWGYNYNLGYDYIVTFTGPNIPPALYTLQTLISCNGQINGGYTMPLSGGAGYSTTTTNPYISNDGSAYNYNSPKPSCTSATVQNLPCNAIQLVIEGPGIPYQVISCNAVTALPVEFISFKGAFVKEQNLLSWDVESEHNCKGYELFKSNDGENWRHFASVPAKGVEGKPVGYTFADIDPEQGVNYYKLTQYDLDGAAAELSTITVYSDISETGNLHVFPNPAASENITFVYTTSGSGEYVYRLTDLSGRVVLNKEILQSEHSEKGYTMTEEILLPATSQTYLLEILADDKPVTRKRIMRL